jgi:DNA gyrase/topoisomerase IV, subunit A
MQVVTKRAQRSLALKEARLHLVTGFLAVAADVEAVVKAIRGAHDGKAAKAALLQGWSLSDEQADAVLNMALRRLTGLAIGELSKEDAQLKKDIKGLQKLLADKARCCPVLEHCRMQRLQRSAACTDHKTGKRARRCARGGVHKRPLKCTKCCMLTCLMILAQRARARSSAPRPTLPINALAKPWHINGRGVQSKVLGVVAKEADELDARYGRSRRTQIADASVSDVATQARITRTSTWYSACNVLACVAAAARR